MRRPPFSEFLAALVAHWASAVSGGLSVPFTVLGLSAPQNQQPYFFALAAMCFVVAAYLVWAGERTAANEQRNRADELAELIAHRPTPDWTIRELFYYIDPDVDDATTNRWEKVGLEIRDRASLGQLNVWGRLKRQSSSLLNEGFALEAIPSDFWSWARFTYFFLQEGSENAEHVKGRTMGEVFTDLRVNRTQAMRLWPRRDERA